MKVVKVDIIEHDGVTLRARQQAVINVTKDADGDYRAHMIGIGMECYGATVDDAVEGLTTHIVLAWGFMAVQDNRSRLKSELIEAFEEV